MNFERFSSVQYANIFSYLPSDGLKGYAELDEETLQLVGDVPGYVGYERVKNSVGIFIERVEAVNELRGPMVACL